MGFHKRDLQKIMALIFLLQNESSYKYFYPDLASFCIFLHLTIELNKISIKFEIYFSDHGSSATSQPHPVLELNERRPVYRNYRLLMNGTLFVSKTSEEDEGKFICEADNGVNEPIGKLVALKVNGTLYRGGISDFSNTLR